MDMVERVEAAILAADEKWYRAKYAHLAAGVLSGVIADLRRDMDDNYAVLAIAAIEAMREPDMAMQNAGWREIEKQGFQTEDTEVAPIYREMIDSILKSTRETQ